MNDSKSRVKTLRHNRAHDYPYLVRRWRAVARKAGLTLRKYAEASGYDLFYLETPASAPARRPGARSQTNIYLSAGIHGDEPAATEALIVWAEKNISRLKALNVLIFPCLNPWGLASNCRLNADGRDLNRSYHNDSIPQIAAQVRLMKGRRFDLAVALHEDYDARGLYLYEVPATKPYWGEELIKAAARHIAIEDRRRIEGRAAKDGIVRRSIKPDLMPDWPEAFVLAFNHCDRVFTIETPSEFHLDTRVDAHVAALTRAVALAKEAAARAR